MINSVRIVTTYLSPQEQVGFPHAAWETGTPQVQL